MSASPPRKGKMEDIVKQRRPRFYRQECIEQKKIIDLMTVDLITVLGEVGIVIHNVPEIASKLSSLGWTKTKIVIDE